MYRQVKRLPKSWVFRAGYCHLSTRMLQIERQPIANSWMRILNMKHFRVFGMRLGARASLRHARFCIKKKRRSNNLITPY